MIVEIKPTDNDNEFKVNGKTVRKDMEGVWQETADLTPSECRFFSEYLNTISHHLLSSLTATYTT